MSLIGGRWLLNKRLERRTLLLGAGAAAMAALATACGGPPSPAAAGEGRGEGTLPPSSGRGLSSPLTPPGDGNSPAIPTVSGSGVPARSPAPTDARSLAPRSAGAAVGAEGGGAETVYAFNVGSRDVTIIDAASRQVRETRPLGAAVRFLSNEQTYWDGERVWTYDFPDNRVEAIAIDPRSVAVVKRVKDIGSGPAHSVMLLPGKKTAAINVAGDNLIAFINLEAGVVEDTLKTGAFP